jgi:PAS domain S-box-containing protein
MKMRNPQFIERDQFRAGPRSVRNRTLPFRRSFDQVSDTERIFYGTAAVLLSFLSGWLILRVEPFGWYGPEVGLAIFAVANGTIFIILLWNGVLSARMHDRHERGYQEIMDNSIDVICTFDAESRFLWVNRACERLWGYLPEELIGRPFIEMVHPEDQEKTRNIDQSILSGVSAGGFENRYLRKDGTVVWIVWTANWSEALRINVCVARDMTARKEMEIELLRTGKAAESASLAKSQFLATISHEIRTPMNGIIGMTDIVLATELDRYQREYLGIVKSSARALLGLLNDILDFSKVEAGKLVLEAISFSLRTCIGSVLKTLGMRADEKGLELTADLPPKVPDHLIGDPMRLRQILINLVDNAIKFTEKGDVMLSVAVEFATDELCCLHFAISDTGIGIPTSKQVLIFEAFTQVDGSTTRTHGGTGLGLAIVAHLVRQMEGRIWVESTLGAGTAFHFTVQLPVGQAALADARAVVPLPLKDLRVLVVDDNAGNRRILRAMLENWEMLPTVVSSGAEALEEMHRAVRLGMPFPLVLLDGMMPEMDGFAVAAKMSDQTELAGATVMMLSSALSAAAAERCGELHIAGYFMKPVSESELLDAILLAIGGDVERRTTDARPSVAAVSGLRILIADDNAANRAVAEGILGQSGHTFVHVANGREAVETAGRESFDLIFMDVQMPEVDGIEAVRRIREAERGTGRHTPIAAMTAHAMIGDRERYLAAGMDDYLSKPMKKAEVLALLQQISPGPLAPKLSSNVEILAAAEEKNHMADRIEVAENGAEAPNNLK